MAKLTIPYRVESVLRGQVRKTGDFGGEQISALVDCVEVELVAPAPHGSTKHVFTGGDIPIALEKYVVGKKIDWEV